MRRLLIALCLLIASPSFGAVARRHRFKLNRTYEQSLSRRPTDSLKPDLYVIFTGDRMYHKYASTGNTLAFSRASDALDMSVFPPVLVSSNVVRYNGGVSVEPEATNLVKRNVVFDASKWTVEAGLTLSDDTTINLYDGHSFKCVCGAANKAFYGNPAVVLTADEYAIECLVYTDGSAVTSSDMQLYADSALATTFKPYGGGAYVAYATFTATAAGWDLGCQIKANKTVYVSLVTCWRYDIADGSWNFPQSFIPNDTDANVKRERDILTVLGAGYCDGNQVTADLAYHTLMDMADHNVHYTLSMDAVTRYHNIFGFSLGAGSMVKLANYTLLVPSGSYSWSRGDLVKVRVLHSTTDLEGGKRAILYTRLNDGAWSEEDSMVDVTEAIPSSALIGVGLLSDGNFGQTISGIKFVRIWNGRALYPPGW